MRMPKIAEIAVADQNYKNPDPAMELKFTISMCSYTALLPDVPASNVVVANPYLTIQKDVVLENAQ